MKDLIILAVGLKPKAGPNTGVLPPQFRFGVRGSELVMLTLAGRVAVVDGRIKVRDQAPLADPALNRVLSKLIVSGGAELKRWIVEPPPEYVISYFERLLAAGAIRQVHVGGWLTAKRAGYVVVDQAYFQDVRARLHAAVTSPGPITAALAALAGVVYAAGLAELAYPGAANAVPRNRLKQLAGESPASGAARTGSHAVPVTDDPNRLAPFRDPAGGIGVAAIEAAVRSATEAAVHAVASSVYDVFHAASDASTSLQYSSGSGSSGSSPSHHHSGSGSSSPSHHHSSGSGSSDSSPSHHH
jgi:hypothetical protein